ncbi:MAG: hypothetical protein ABIP74_01135 [Candidatus Saccharimonas sp.]
MAKKKSSSTKSAKHVSLSPTHVMIKRSIVSYALLVFLFFAMATMSWYLVDRMVASRVSQTRLDRISSIYTSLSLGDSYRIVTSNVFGDKRVYDWDKGRTFSSSVEYGHNDTVTNTFADLKKKVEAAGFTYVQSEYTESIARIDEYKDSSGEYVRVSVVNADVREMTTYGTPTSVSEILDTNAAPSYVTIKVNLDDNNE